MAKIGLIKDDVDIIEKVLSKDDNFYYDICEGGYKSLDGKVIVVVMRSPYNKQILQCTEDDSKSEFWISYLSGKFKIN